MSEWTELSATITGKLNTVIDRHGHSEWLLHSILAKVSKMVTDVDTFVKDMTAQMDTMEAGVASLRPFIQGLFDQIGKIPGLTDVQKTELDAIELRVASDAAKIVASMGPPVPPPAP